MDPIRCFSCGFLINPHFEPIRLFMAEKNMEKIEQYLLENEIERFCCKRLLVSLSDYN